MNKVEGDNLSRLTLNRRFLDLNFREKVRTLQCYTNCFFGVSYNNSRVYLEVVLKTFFIAFFQILVAFPPFFIMSTELWLILGYVRNFRKYMLGAISQTKSG